MVKDGEPWFMGKDVAEVLGYADPAKSIKMHVDDEDKLTRQFVVSGQRREMIIINESGLFLSHPFFQAVRSWSNGQMVKHFLVIPNY